MNNPHKGDTMVSIVISIVDENDDSVDVADMTTMLIKYEKPDGTHGSWNASFVSDGTDGQIFYRTISTTDLDQVGEWRYQGYCSDGITEFHTTIASFHVLETL